MVFCSSAPKDQENHFAQFHFIRVNYFPVGYALKSGNGWGHRTLKAKIGAMRFLRFRAILVFSHCLIGEMEKGFSFLHSRLDQRSASP